MITRKRFSQEFKRTISLEVASGVSTAGMISKREGISSNTIYKWRDQFADYRMSASDKDLNESRRKIKELEEIIGDQAIQIHILKKTQKIMEDLKKQERLSAVSRPEIWSRNELQGIRHEHVNILL